MFVIRFSISILLKKSITVSLRINFKSYSLDTCRRQSTIVLELEKPSGLDSKSQKI